MPINRRQKLLYRYVIDLWRGVKNPPGQGVPPLLTDFNSSYNLIAQGLLCLYWSTPEYDESRIAGRSKVDNIFTQDKWKFTADVDVRDTDLIVCTFGPNNFPLVGRGWAVSGNTMLHTTTKWSNCQQVYSRLIDVNVKLRGNSYPTQWGFTS
jgi:hypothetical protein